MTVDVAHVGEASLEEVAKAFAPMFPSMEVVAREGEEHWVSPAPHVY